MFDAGAGEGDGEGDGEVAGCAQIVTEKSANIINSITGLRNFIVTAPELELGMQPAEWAFPVKLVLQSPAFDPNSKLRHASQ